MISPYSEKEITPLDIYFGSSLMVVSLTLGINTLIQSIYLVYAVILFVLTGLLHATRIYDRENSLRGLWILGILSLILYPIFDYFLDAKFGLVSYLTDDPKIIRAPIYILPYWVLGVLLFGYLCYRIQGLTKKVWLAGVATGLFSAISTTFVENLFNSMGFYKNTPCHLMILHVPLYVPLGYIAAFSFIPFHILHKYFCGMLLYGFTGIMWLFFSRIIL